MNKFGFKGNSSIANGEVLSCLDVCLETNDVVRADLSVHTHVVVVCDY